MDDLFRGTFLSVHEHISGSVNLSKHLVSSPTKTRYQNERSERRGRLEAFRSRARSGVCSSLQELTTAKELLHLRRLESTDKCSQYYYFALRQLQNQGSGAERRMRELVFEVIGEYGKSILRAKRRHMYLRFSNRVDRIWSIFTMRWKLFIHRLVYESLCCCFPDGPALGLVDSLLASCKILCPAKDSREMKYVNQVLTSLVDMKYIVCTVVKCDLSKVLSVSSPRVAEGRSVLSQSNKPPVHNLCSGVVASNSAELKQLIEQFKSRITGPVSGAAGSRPRTSGSRGVSNSQNLKGNSSRPGSSSAAGDSYTSDGAANGKIDLLSMASIEWLRPSSYNSISEETLLLLNTSNKQPHHRKYSRQNQFDCFSSRYVCQHSAHSSTDYLYFCLEERSRSELLEENGTLMMPSSDMSSAGRRSTRGALSTEQHLSLSLLAHLQVCIDALLLSFLH